MSGTNFRTVRRVAAASLVMAGAIPATAHACSCAVPGARTALRTSAAVFSGRVTAFPDSGRTGDLGAAWRLAYFAPDAQWKLPPAIPHPEVIPVYALDLKTSSCGLALTLGERYLVFAVSDSAGRLTTGWCEGTRLYAQSTPAVAALGAGHPIEEPDRRRLIAAFAAVAAMLVVAIVLSRRRPAAWSGR